MLLTSTGFKTQLLGPSSFTSVFDGGVIQAYAAGTRVSSADLAAPAPSLLGSVGLTGGAGALQFSQNGAFIVIPLGQWWQLLVQQGGTAGWFRLLTATDSGQSGQTDPRIDGDIGTPSAPAEMVLSNTTLAAGTAVSIDSFVFTLTP